MGGSLTLNDNDDVHITGASDQSQIGNVSDQFKVSDIPYVSGVNSELTVGLTAVELKVGGFALANRKYILMRPKDNDIYFGYSNAVTTTSGMKLFKDEFLMLPIGVSIWLIASVAGKKISIGELA